MRSCERVWPVSSLLLLRFLESAAGAERPDTVFACNYRRASEPDEETVFHDTGNCVQRLRECSWLWNTAKRCIDYEMSTIGEERLVTSHPSPHFTGKAKAARRFLDGDPGGAKPKRVYFDGQRKAPEHIDKLALVRDHQHAMRGGSHDLLAKQRATAALDEGEVRSHFVGTINREIELRRL